MRKILSFVSGILAGVVLHRSAEIFINRQETVGGEVLIVPMIIILLVFGWDMGRESGYKKGIDRGFNQGFEEGFYEGSNGACQKII